MIKTLLCVAIGGACGALARYGVYYLLEGPLATLAVNVVGCFIAGVLAALFGPEHPARALVVVGFLGAFTAFSAFSLNTLSMANEGRAVAAMVYAFVTTIGSLAAVFCGFALGKVLSVA